MAYEISFTEPSGGKLAHQVMLERIRDLAALNGWTVLRFDDTSTNHELILKGEGLSGTEEIFVGFRTYQDAGADYYNLAVGGFTGYVAGNSFDTQPAAMISGVPAHNNRIDYWLAINGQRIILAMKVGTPVYEMCYAGKMLPYATPGQYPYPLVSAGMLDGPAATRFSDTTHSMPFKGNGPNGTSRRGMRLRNTAGAWLTPWCWPWGLDGQGVTVAGSTYALRDTENVYSLLPVVLHDNSGVNNAIPSSTGNIFGELDGVFFVSGFDNAVENTLVIGGVTYVVIQDVWRTGHSDYCAIRMD